MRVFCLIVWSCLAVISSLAQAPKQRTLAVVSRVETNSVLTVQRRGVLVEESAGTGAMVFDGDVLRLKSGSVSLIRADGRERVISGAGTWPQVGDLDGLNPEPLQPFMTRVSRWLKSLDAQEKQAGGRNTGSQFDPASLHLLAVDFYEVDSEMYRALLYWADAHQGISAPRLLLLGEGQDILQRVDLPNRSIVLTNGPWCMVRGDVTFEARKVPSAMRISDSKTRKSSAAVPWKLSVNGDETTQGNSDWAGALASAAEGREAAALDHLLNAPAMNARHWDAMSLLVRDWAERNGQSRALFAPDAFFRRARGDKE